MLFFESHSWIQASVGIIIPFDVHKGVVGKGDEIGEKLAHVIELLSE